MNIVRKGSKPLEQGVIAVDCGVNGAMALFTNKRIIIEKMPNTGNYDSFEKVKMMLYKLRQIALEEFNNKYPICFVEHVGGRGGDSAFSIAKLTYNYGVVCAYAEGFGMHPVTFPPVSWKAYLKVMYRKPKGYKGKVSDATKKEPTMTLLKHLYPWLQYTKPECDAIAIGEFGRRVLTGELQLKKNHAEERKLIEFLKTKVKS